MLKPVTVGATAFLGCILCATPVTLRLSPEGKVSLSMESASAVDAGVNRRAHRRAYRRDYLSPSGHGYDAYCGFEIAVTIQPMSGSATTDSGGTTDLLTLRGGHAEGGGAPALRP